MNIVGEVSLRVSLLSDSEMLYDTASSSNSPTVSLEEYNSYHACIRTLDKEDS